MDPEPEASLRSQTSLSVQTDHLIVNISGNQVSFLPPRHQVKSIVLITHNTRESQAFLPTGHFALKASFSCKIYPSSNVVLEIGFESCAYTATGCEIIVERFGSQRTNKGAPGSSRHKADSWVSRDGSRPHVQDAPMDLGERTPA